MREIVLDTETTGLDPLRGDRVVEIGCVEMVDRRLTGRTFHQYINPQRDMPQEAFDVHGLSAEFLSDKPLFGDIARAFIDFIGDATLVIHNATFDMAFLDAEFQRLKLPLIPRELVVDSLMLARRKHPGARVSLDELCARYGIDSSRRTKHGALLDSELLAEVYLDLISSRQSQLILADEIPAMAGGITDTPRRTRPVPLLSRVTEEDRVVHRAFIAQMGDKALWNQFWPEGER